MSCAPKIKPVYDIQFLIEKVDAYDWDEEAASRGRKKQSRGRKLKVVIEALAGAKSMAQIAGATCYRPNAVEPREKESP